MGYRAWEADRPHFGVAREELPDLVVEAMIKVRKLLAEAPDFIAAHDGLCALIADAPVVERDVYREVMIAELAARHLWR